MLNYQKVLTSLWYPQADYASLSSDWTCRLLVRVTIQCDQCAPGDDRVGITLQYSQTCRNVMECLYMYTYETHTHMYIYIYTFDMIWYDMMCSIYIYVHIQRSISLVPRAQPFCMIECLHVLFCYWTNQHCFGHRHLKLSQKLDRTYILSVSNSSKNIWKYFIKFILETFFFNFDFSMVSHLSTFIFFSNRTRRGPRWPRTASRAGASWWLSPRCSRAWWRWSQGIAGIGSGLTHITIEHSR